MLRWHWIPVAPGAATTCPKGCKFHSKMKHRSWKINEHSCFVFKRKMSSWTSGPDFWQTRAGGLLDRTSGLLDRSRPVWIRTFDKSGTCRVRNLPFSIMAIEVFIILSAEKNKVHWNEKQHVHTKSDICRNKIVLHWGKSSYCPFVDPP